MVHVVNPSYQVLARSLICKIISSMLLPSLSKGHFGENRSVSYTVRPIMEVLKANNVEKKLSFLKVCWGCANRFTFLL